MAGLGPANLAPTARVDLEGFYAAVGARLDPPLDDLVCSPFAKLVYLGYAELTADGGVTPHAEGAAPRVALPRLAAALAVVDAIARTDLARPSLDRVGFTKRWLDPDRVPGVYGAGCGLTADHHTAWRRYCGAADAKAGDAFAQWDVDGDGALSVGEQVMMQLTMGRVAEVFAAMAARGGRAGSGPTTTVYLNAREFFAVPRAIGYGDLQAPWVQLLHSKAKVKGARGVDVFAAVAAVARLQRPVSLVREVQRIPGWPGWPAFAPGAAASASTGPATRACWRALREQLATLRTGDVLVMALTDGYGRYLSYLGDCLWSHTAVVINHNAPPRRGGSDIHAQTQAALAKAPARWQTHRFCSPRYCRCCAYESTAEYTAQLEAAVAASGVELLEATAQGVHVHNLTARMFVGFNAQRVGTLAARRLARAEGRDDIARVEAFVAKVRGTLFSVPGGRKKGLGETYVCTQLVTAFYAHMGWLPAGSPHPSPGDVPTLFKAIDAPPEIALDDARAAWGPLEVIRDEWRSRPLPMAPPALRWGTSRIQKPRL